jgi:hypothetical protein
LGACLAFKGIAGAVPLLHGSQGCATYIRRYLISHFREPVDIASTNFSEDAAVFGGRKNLHTALDNVGRQYRPALVGIATTCLSETMGENMPMLIGEYGAESRDLPPAAERPALVHVSTPSFKGTHADGFHATVRALVETLAEDCGGRAGPPGPPTERTARRSVPTGQADRRDAIETRGRRTLERNKRLALASSARMRRTPKPNHSAIERTAVEKLDLIAIYFAVQGLLVQKPQEHRRRLVSDGGFPRPRAAARRIECGDFWRESAAVSVLHGLQAAQSFPAPPG